MAGTALLRMINSQADALERMTELDLAGPAAVLAQASRVIIVGTGTSLHAAELGAMMLTTAMRGLIRASERSGEAVQHGNRSA